MFRLFTSFYDKYYKYHKLVLIERFIVTISICTFIIHLTLILLANNSSSLSFLTEYVGKNPITSFISSLSVVLFYEIIHLILAIPKSIIISIQKQFEVVSLIIIRESFKVLGSAESTAEVLTFDSPKSINFITYFLGGILIFILTAIFHKIAANAAKIDEETCAKDFMDFKKFIAVLLIFITIILAFIDITQLARNIFNFNYRDFDYIKTLFFILIFVDFLIFLVSMYFTDDYGIVFMDSAMVLSTIVIRFALGFSGYEKVLTVIGAVVTSITVLASYYYLWGISSIRKQSN